MVRNSRRLKGPVLAGWLAGWLSGRGGCGWWAGWVGMRGPKAQAARAPLAPPERQRRGGAPARSPARPWRGCGAERTVYKQTTG